MFCDIFSLSFETGVAPQTGAKIVKWTAVRHIIATTACGVCAEDAMLNEFDQLFFFSVISVFAPFCLFRFAFSVFAFLRRFFFFFFF